MKGLYAPPHDGTEAAIPVERIAGPILLVSATEDRLWPSTAFREMVESRLKERGFIHECSHLRCEGGGALNRPIGPASEFNNFQMPGSSMRLDLGGSPQASSECQQQIWTEIYRFLAALKREPLP